MAESDRINLIANITASYLRRNLVAVDQIGAVVAAVADALEGASRKIAGTAADPAPQPTVVEETPRPAVSIKKSVQTEYIVCLEDGKRARTLKRHLQTAHGLTPRQYREKWRLPRDYPMVAPAYSAHRSKMAKASGLGRKAATATRAKAKRRSKGEPRAGTPVVTP